MEDRQVLNQIEKLFAEEDRLYADPDLKNTEVERIHKIKVELDQWWDYLRQRRALRNAGKDPNDASVRPPEIVENYEQ
jgi:flagellar biosynthesis/type III secretory pathway chaperone